MKFTDNQLANLVLAVQDSMKKPLPPKVAPMWQRECEALLHIIREEMNERGMFDDNRSGDDNSDFFGDN